MPCLAGSAPFRDLDDLGKASTIAKGLGTLQLQIHTTSKGSYKLATPLDDIIRDVHDDQGSHNFESIVRVFSLSIAFRA
jgi:hypothetical protein